MKLIVSVVALAAAVSLTSCSGGQGHPASTVSATPATRWWSDGAEAAGTTIDPNNPSAAAKNLHPSRPAYCSMLKQTLTAGHSLFAGVTGSSPALVASTEAFIAELEGVAPAEVSSSWKVLGTSVLALVQSGGKTASATSAAQIDSAVTTVANDAKTRCGVSLAAS